MTKNVIVNDKKILEDKKNNFKLNKHCKSLFRESTSKTSTEYVRLSNLGLPKLTHDNMMLCEGNLTRK